MPIDMSQFLETFYEESFEGLDTMESELLNLDMGSVDEEAINTIFRAAHSIKGGSATFGLNSVATFTHLMETLLDQMRDGQRDITQDAVNILLSSVDVLREMLNAIRSEDELDTARIAEIEQQLNTLLGNKTAQHDGAEQASTGANSVTAEEAKTEGASIWNIHFKPHVHMLQTGNDPLRMIRELSALGDLEVTVDVSALPSVDNISPEDAYLSWDMVLDAEVEKTTIEQVFEWVDDECDLEITCEVKKESVLNSPDTPAVMEKNKTEVKKTETNKLVSEKRQAGKQAEGNSIRVSIDKIDDLINMMGELVITQSMLSQFGESEDFGPSEMEKLSDGLAQLERNTREMQENVMRIRMLPISFAFQRFPRLVHDLSSKLDKKIELRMTGEHTELDKTVMEKIGDPLVHLVRNSIDHGIESPEIRRAAGKPEVGEINLNAFHEGGNIVIEVIDDGAGLNRQRIIAKARKNQLIAEDETLSDEQVNDLIFDPGFSTAEVVSDVSGRGVGMDVVRRNIRALGGTVDIKTEEGKGSKFTIRLPLTLAILDGQSIRVGNDIYIVSLVSIVESVQVKNELVNGVAGRAELYRLRSEYIPIVRLYDVFCIEPSTRDLEKGLLVVVEGEGVKIALFVDDLLGQQQVVIKSLETNFKKVEGVSGATILGDGTVALILDIAGLIHLSRGKELYKKSIDGSGAERAA